MIKVEGGTFSMGATSEQGIYVDDDEKPVRSFILSDYYDEKPVRSFILSDYYIGETEVTQELWEAVMGSNPSYFKGNNQRPVEYVSWYDCQEFIKKLNQLTGKEFRLPIEAEWVYAARGGKYSKDYVYKYSGSNNADEVAWYNDNSCDETHPVKTKKANKLGLYDMSGNVYEWCNYPIPSKGKVRVLRGGSWNCDFVHVSSRIISFPADRFDYYGLRLASEFTTR